MLKYDQSLGVIMKYLFILVLFILSAAYATENNIVSNIIKKKFNNMEFEEVIAFSKESKKTPELQYYIAISYMYANERNKDDSKTLGLLRESAKKGYKPAKKYLASLYRRGYIVPKDLKYSEQLYRELGDTSTANSIKKLENYDFIYQSYKSYMNTVRFFQLSIRNDISRTRMYLNDILKYRSKKGKNISIKKENIDKVYNRLFNEKYKSLVLADWKKKHNLFPSCFRLGYGAGQGTPTSTFGKYGKGQIHIWFYDNGLPYVIANDFMIKASFDCNKASNTTEKAICNSYELASLDMELSNIYEDAKRYLTDDAYINLKKEQRTFIKQRNKCENNETCIRLIIKNRIDELKVLIDNENSKDISSIQNYEQKITGVWKTKKYIDAIINGAFGGNWEDYYKNINKIKKIIIVPPEVLFYDKNDEVLKTSTIDKIIFDTWAKVYKRTAYKRYYGNSGSRDLNRLPFAGHYISLSLDHGSAFLILSGQKLDKLFYSTGQVDDILVLDGLLLEK